MLSSLKEFPKPKLILFSLPEFILPRAPVSLVGKEVEEAECKQFRFNFNLGTGAYRRESAGGGGYRLIQNFTQGDLATSPGNSVWNFAVMLS